MDDMKLLYRYRIIVVFFFSLIVSGMYGQSPTKKQYLIQAEKDMASKNFYGALIHYNNALEFSPFDTDILFKSAEAARQFNSYNIAIEKYKLLIDSLKEDAFPSAVFWLANMQQHVGDYDAAERNYKIYLSEYGDRDSILSEKAGNELTSLEFAKNQLANSKKYIKIEKLGDDINTPSSEFAGKAYGDDFYFSSERFIEQGRKKHEPGRNISKLFKKSEDSTAVLIPGFVNERNESVSHLIFNHDRTIAYYTICTYINDSDLRCDIYKSDVDEEGNFINEQKLPDPINMEGYSTTQPFITMDTLTGREAMYFVSNRPDGKGGLDLWYSVHDPRFGFSEPVNLEILNTSGNEITPFYNQTTGTLYFSTDGRETMGGYDVYKAIRTNGMYSQPENAGAPINSSYNDIHYFEIPDGSTAYLSSNRNDAYFIDSYLESCCYDIYEANIEKIELNLNVLTYDALTGRDLKEVTITVYDKITGKSESIYNDEGNDHLYTLLPDREFMIVAEREFYYPDTIMLSTKGYDKTESIERKIFMKTDKVLLDVFTFAKIGKMPLSGVKITIDDLTHPNNKQEVQLNPLSNDFLFYLDTAKVYRITAEKETYTTEIDSISTLDTHKSVLLKKEMYLDKFVLPDLLPIALYFENDVPTRGSTVINTDANYGDLIDDYIDQKEAYIETFTKGLSGEILDEALIAYEEFFEGNVKGGYDIFKLFTDRLKEELEAGNVVELILKGYTSPLAESTYNLNLGQRRVASVKNEILNSDPDIARYFDEGLLKIEDISLGKEFAPPEVSADGSDKRNSVYNLNAAKERRVEILRASRKDSGNSKK